MAEPMFPPQRPTLPTLGNTSPAKWSWLDDPRISVLMQPFQPGQNELMFAEALAAIRPFRVGEGTTGFGFDFGTGIIDPTIPQFHIDHPGGDGGGGDGGGGDPNAPDGPGNDPGSRGRQPPDPGAGGGSEADPSGPGGGVGSGTEPNGDPNAPSPGSGVGTGPGGVGPTAGGPAAGDPGPPGGGAPDPAGMNQTMRGRSNTQARMQALMMLLDHMS